jgi:heptosyltransferase I
VTRPSAAALPPGARICIVMLSAVGDSVHVLPVVVALKRRDPSCHVTWLLEAGPAALHRGHPCVDEIIVVNSRAGVRGYAALRHALAGRAFDLVIDLQVALKGGIATALVRAPVKLGFDRRRARDVNWLFTTHRIPPHARQHAQDQYFEFLAYLGVPHEPVEWHIEPREHERQWQREFFARLDRPAAAIVVGTSDPNKDWLPDRWARLCDALADDYDLCPVIVGGASAREAETAAAIARLTRRPPANALGSGLRPLVSILDGAALVVSPDTAPLHISVAIGTPVVSLMGQTSPRRSGPYRRFHDLVVDAFTDPEDGDRVIWDRRPGRMARITVDDVLAKVARWRERYAGEPQRVGHRARPDGNDGR